LLLYFFREYVIDLLLPLTHTLNSPSFWHLFQSRINL